MTDDFKFSDHIDKYPPVIPRAKVNQYFPWLSQKRLANLDKLGQGPEHSFKNGRAVLYPTLSFLVWLDGRTRPHRYKPNPKTTNCNKDRQQDNQPLTKRRGRKRKEQEVRERRL